MKNVFKVLGVAFAACAMFVACGDENTFTIKVTVNDSDMGSATGGGKYALNEVATLEATANAGYKFVNWDDGSTNNPYLVTVTEDKTYQANFEANSGVNVTFGTTTWDAQYINAQMAQNGMVMACGQTSATSYPLIQLYYAPEAGLATGSASASHSMEEAGDGSVSIYFGNPYLWYFESTNVPFQSGTKAGDWWSNPVTINITELDLTGMTASLVANATMAHFTDLLNDEGYLTSVDLNDAESRSLTMTVTNQTFTAAQKSIFRMPAASMKLAK